MAGGEHTHRALQAADIMTRNPVAVDITGTVQDAIDVIFASEVRHIPVVDQGNLVGMVSDRDLRSYMFPRFEQIIWPHEARTHLNANVCTVMRTDIITVTTDTPVADIVDILLREKIGAVPVLHATSHALLGMVSYVDLLRVARAFF